MTKVNMSGWTQEQMANWQDPMLAGTGFNRPGVKPRQQNAGIMGLGAFGQNPHIQGGPQGGPRFGFIQDTLGGPKAGWPPQQPQAPQDPWGVRGMGEQITGFGETLGGFGEQLGGYKDLLSGFGEKFGSFGERLGGFKDEFSGINDKLQNLEQGIASLTDKFGTQQQQNPYQQNFGMNPFGSINPYTPFFGGLGMFMRRY